MNFPIAPEQASVFAGDVDQIFYVLCGLTFFFTALVLSLMIFLAIRYRRGSRYSRKGAVDEHLLIELSWSIGPLLIGLVVFIWAAKPFTYVYRPPADAKEVFVIGKRWMWHLQHANGIRENNELHIPVGKAVKLTMISQDVIHGFYVPAFRAKRDVLPGRYNTVWFQPTKVGKYHLYCSEYCGTNHSEMGGWVYVMEPADYQQWIDNHNTRDTMQHETLVTQGESLYNTLACNNCHVSNNNVHGPTLYGLYNKRREFSNADPVNADDTYLRESIINPSAKVVTGYQNIMPAYPAGPEQGQLSEEQVLALVAYIRTLGTATPAPPPSATEGKQGKPAKPNLNTTQGTASPTTAAPIAPASSPANTTNGNAAPVGTTSGGAR